MEETASTSSTAAKEEETEKKKDPEKVENDIVRTIIRQTDDEIRTNARELVRNEEKRKRDHLLRSKGPLDNNPVRVAFLRDVGTGDTIQRQETLDLEGRRVLQSTASVTQKSHDIEKRKSPTASPHTEDT